MHILTTSILIASLSATSPAPPTMSCGTPSYAQALQAGMHFAGGGRPLSNGFYDSTIEPVRVHYTTGYESTATVVLQAAEETLAALNALGFYAPLEDPGGPSYGGDTRMDIYLEVSEYGGYLAPEGFETSTAWADMWGYVSINPDAYPIEYIPSVVAHEVTHAAQFAMDWLEDPAFMEATAAWAMDKVYPAANLAASFIANFQASPELSVDYFDFGQPYQYGASLFYFHLSDVTWNNDAIIPYLWQATIQDEAPNDNEPDSFDALSDALGQELSIGIEEQYADFARARFFTGGYDDGTFAYGSTYDQPARAATFFVDSLPDTPQGFSMAELGAVYVGIGTHSAATDSTLTLDVTVPTNKEWSLRALAFTAGQWQTDFELTPDAEGIASLTIEVLDTYDEIYLIIANLGDGFHDPDSDDWFPSNVDLALSYVAPEKESDEPVGCACTMTPAQKAPSSGLSVLALLMAALVTIRRRR